MSEFQAITLLVTLVGFVATILNLVAFFREKDKSHVRAGLKVLLVVVVMLALLFFPRYAPGPARQLSVRLPASARRVLEPWLQPSTTPTPVLLAEVTPSPQATQDAAPLQGSFTLDLRRNLLGGIDSLMAQFQFSNLTSESARVTAYQIRYLDPKGQCTHSFYRVLSQPIEIGAQAHDQKEVEMDAEIRDCWVAGLDREVAERDRVEVTWEGLDARGHRFKLTSSNG